MGSCDLVTKTPVLTSSFWKKKKKKKRKASHHWHPFKLKYSDKPNGTLKVYVFWQRHKVHRHYWSYTIKIPVVNSPGNASARHLRSLWLIGRLSDLVSSPADYFSHPFLKPSVHYLLLSLWETRNSYIVIFIRCAKMLSSRLAQALSRHCLHPEENIYVASGRMNIQSIFVVYFSPNDLASI